MLENNINILEKWYGLASIGWDLARSWFHPCVIQGWTMIHPTPGSPNGFPTWAKQVYSILQPRLTRFRLCTIGGIGQWQIMTVNIWRKGHYFMHHGPFAMMSIPSSWYWFKCRLDQLLWFTAKRQKPYKGLLVFSLSFYQWPRQFRTPMSTSN